MTATLTPAGLDREAARVVGRLTAGEQREFDRIAADYARTAPRSGHARRLVTKTVDELVAEALSAPRPAGGRPEVEVRLPGRLAAALPDWALPRRREALHGPDMVLHVAAAVLREWGWQAKPGRLRDWRGRRCVCGAIATATDGLGVGVPETAHLAAGHVLAELRRQGWGGLIGDWNRQASASAAIQLVETAAANAGGRR